MSQRRPVFYFLSSGRLIGRLTHLFYGLRFARQVGGEFVAVWYPPSRTSARYDHPPTYLLENIFNLEEWRSQMGDDLWVSTPRAARSATWLALEGPEFAQMRPDKFDRSYFLDRDVETSAIRFPQFQFSDEKKSRAEINSEMSVLFRSMPLAAKVQEALNQATDKIGGDRFLAVHVRRSDVCDWLQADLLKFIDGTLAPGKLRFSVANFLARAAPPQSYFPEIASAIAARRKIVFTSDVPDSIVPYEKYFGSEHFVDLATLIDVPSPIQKAFCDFNLLTMAEKIVSTGSIFANTASILGNTQISNVATDCSVEEVEKFAVMLLVPQFAGNREMRDALSLEIAKYYADRKVAPGGRLEMRRERAAALQQQAAERAERKAAAEQQRLAAQQLVAERAERKAAAEQQRLAVVQQRVGERAERKAAMQRRFAAVQQWVAERAERKAATEQRRLAAAQQRAAERAERKAVAEQQRLAAAPQQRGGERAEQRLAAVQRWVAERAERKAAAVQQRLAAAEQQWSAERAERKAVVEQRRLAAAQQQLVAESAERTAEGDRTERDEQLTERANRTVQAQHGLAAKSYFSRLVNWLRIQMRNWHLY